MARPKKTEGNVTPIKPPLDQRERSRKLANIRVRVLIKRMRMMAMLGASHHDLNEDQIDKIILTLTGEFESMIEHLHKKAKPTEITDII